MRTIQSILVAIAFVGTTNAFAQGTPATTTTPAENVKAMTAPAKKEGRKKKVAMCAECGKPETQCECKDHEGHKEDKKNK